MSETEVRFRVRYAETDQMGVVYHSNYLVWMEMGRVELCRDLGVRYRDMEGEGILLAVAEAKCRYRSPARYDEEIVVRPRVVRATTRLVEFGYEISSAETGASLASGSTTHVVCGPDLRPRRLPQKYWPAFGIQTAESA